MKDEELHQAIERALRQPGAEALPALTALRDQLQAERGPLDPALRALWDALVQVAQRTTDDMETALRHLEGRARWLAAARGANDAETLAAWLDLGETAELECDWDTATRAWEAVAATPPRAGDAAAEPSISPALRGLGVRRLVAGRLDEAQQLFERDLTIQEQRYPTGHPQLALAIDNLALVLERRGQGERSLALRQRERAVLVASGASAGQLATVEQHIARLRAS